jgi:signal transduction histidine kinase
VHVETVGDVEPLPGAVDLAAFRIVQEAITNVTRHAADATGATVRLVYDPDALTVEVDDDGRASNGTSPGAGAGIVGMRERATALGGTLDAGPRAGGGFRVHARLPRKGSE